MKLPSSLPKQLLSRDKVIGWIAELTSQPPDSVLSRLSDEFQNCGSNVVRSFRESGLQPYVWSEGMSRFYQQTDAFIYELVLWNLNRIKRRMRRWIAEYLRGKGQNLEILTIGDGLGFDSEYLSGLGHNVTYFEVPGYTQSFAKKVFAESGNKVTVLTEPKEIPLNAYDAVVCLDVLEHVPDPDDMVRRIVEYLRPGGSLVVHAPVYMIHPSNPTHLKSNRRFSGSLSLFRKHNLQITDGATGWNPIVLQKTESSSCKRPRLCWKTIKLKLMGCFLSLGRFTFLPFHWVVYYRNKKSRWFRD